MDFFQWLFFLFVILIHHYDLITAQTNLCGGAYYNYNSPFHANLNILLSSLSSNTTLGFFNTTIGQNSPDDKAYGLFLCRGDVSIEICKNCVEIASKNITQRCPNKKEAIIWDEKCMLRYSDQSFFSTMQDKPTKFVYNPNNNSNPNEFNRILVDLMGVLVRTAADGSSTLKFATGEKQFTNSQKIYGLVQCTPDLSRIECNTCLLGAVNQISICCNGKEGGRVLQPSCNLRFETFLFYDESMDSAPITPLPPLPPSPSPPPPLPNKTARKAKENSFPIVVVIVVPSIIAIALLSTITAYYCFRKRRAEEKVDDVEEIISVESLQFGFDTIEAATDDFSDANKLGQGGFGAVYKGKLSNGQEIAVKRLSMRRDNPIIHLHQSINYSEAFPIQIRLKQAMGSCQLLIFLCIILIHCDLITAQIKVPNYIFCDGVNSSNSLFPVNVNLLFSSLSSATPNNKFYNATIGQNPPDKVYGLYLCRGDVPPETCKNCVENASKIIIQRCPTQTELFVGYDECMLRYANQSIFSTMQSYPTECMKNDNNISNPEQFNKILNELMDRLVKSAAYGPSNDKFATDEANFIDFRKIYGLVQCTPDLTGLDCERCLIGAVAQIPKCSGGKQGGRVVVPSCNLRYESDPFIVPPSLPLASPQLPSPPPPPPPTITN